MMIKSETYIFHQETFEKKHFLHKIILNGLTMGVHRNDYNKIKLELYEKILLRKKTFLNKTILDGLTKGVHRNDDWK